LPIILPPKDSLAISLSFTPSKSGVYAASFNLRIDGNYNGSPQMIARQVMLSGRTNDIASAAGNLSSKRSYNLAQNYPNPFNPSTLIAYSIPENSHVSIKIYNVLGQLVNEPVNSIEAAGDYKLTWSGENNAGGKVPSGIYLYSIETEKFKAIKKMVLLK
jgi:flagellar hook assembly protein FlgD